MRKRSERIEAFDCDDWVENCEWTILRASAAIVPVLSWRTYHLAMSLRWWQKIVESSVLTCSIATETSLVAGIMVLYDGIGVEY